MLIKLNLDNIHMRTIAIAALLAAPAFSKFLAQSKDDTYAATAYEPTYEVA